MALIDIQQFYEDGLHVWSKPVEAKMIEITFFNDQNDVRHSYYRDDELQDSHPLRIDERNSYAIVASWDNDDVEVKT